MRIISGRWRSSSTREEVTVGGGESRRELGQKSKSECLNFRSLSRVSRRGLGVHRHPVSFIDELSFTQRR